MDLRPKIAAEIVDALLQDQGWKGGADTHGVEVRARWIEIALSKIVCHSLSMEGYGTDDPATVEAFLTKYPKLRPILTDTWMKAREIWPDADLVVEVSSDPEGCHTCREGQSLHLNILRHQDFIPDDPKADAFDDWWLDYTNPDNRDEVFDLFLALPGYAPDEEQK